jgi:Tol biopolymer transport system component
MNRALRALVILSVPAACLMAAPLLSAQRSAAPASAPAQTPARERSPIVVPGEKHLKNIRQLTDGAENAEAYFSFDGKRLSFQSTRGRACDQIYSMNVDGSDVRRISNGEGRTTCSFYYPDGKHILYASTYLAGSACPAAPDQSYGYAWAIYDSYDIFRADADGSNIVRLTSTPGYDAEATIGKDGRVVFTSVRDGDMDLYTMNGDGSDVRRVTNLPGPDGGPFFSPDGTKIVFRGRHPGPGQELDDYFTLLKKAVWRPVLLDIYVIDRDGKNLKQITHGGGANWAPYWTPDGKQIIYASNAKDPKGRNFDLYVINLDGTGLEQITLNDTFDGFPMFSPDGTKLVFVSNRHDAIDGESNIFIADWVK